MKATNYILIILVTLALSACSGNNSNSTTNETNDQTTSTESGTTETNTGGNTTDTTDNGTSPDGSNTPDTSTKPDETTDNTANNGTGNTTSNQNTGSIPNTPASTAPKTSGTVQLGAVQYAQVSITSLDGSKLYYTTNTNSQGSFDINRPQLQQAINAAPPIPTYIKISTRGGTDIDPDDDGVQKTEDYKTVNGSVIGIISVADVMSQEKVSINLISTAVADLLKDKTTVTDQDIKTALSNLNMTDTNGDGVISNADVIGYDMVQHDSGAESKLRYIFLDLIHEGDQENRQTYIDSLQQDKSYITRTEKEENGTLSVTLKPLNSDNHIKYAVSESVSEDQALPNTYQNEALTLNKGEYLYYQECKPDDTCLYREFVYYNGEETTNYYPIPHIGTAYSDPEKIAALRLDYLQKRHYALHPEEYKAKIDEDIETAKSEIAAMEKRLKEVEQEISELGVLCETPPKVPVAI